MPQLTILKFASNKWPAEIDMKFTSNWIEPNLSLNSKFFNHDFSFLVFRVTRDGSPQAILEALRDETLNDPRDRIELAQSHAFYRPSLLGQPWTVDSMAKLKTSLKESEPCINELWTIVYRLLSWSYRQLYVTWRKLYDNAEFQIISWHFSFESESISKFSHLWYSESFMNSNLILVFELLILTSFWFSYIHIYESFCKNPG